MKKQNISNKRSNCKFYSTKKWKELRNSLLRENWCCVKCSRTDNLHIDHIFEVEDDEELFYKKYNLMVLCRDCHFTKTFNYKNTFYHNLKQNSKTLIVKLKNKIDSKHLDYLVETFGLDIALNELKKNIIVQYDLVLLNLIITPNYFYELLSYIFKTFGKFEKIKFNDIIFTDFKTFIKFYLREIENLII